MWRTKGWSFLAPFQRYPLKFSEWMRYHMPSFESKLWHTARGDSYSWERGTETNRKAEKGSALRVTITPPARCWFLMLWPNLRVKTAHEGNQLTRGISSTHGFYYELSKTILQTILKKKPCILTRPKHLHTVNDLQHFCFVCKYQSMMHWQVKIKLSKSHCSFV